MKNPYLLYTTTPEEKKRSQKVTGKVTRLLSKLISSAKNKTLCEKEIEEVGDTIVTFEKERVGVTDTQSREMICSALDRRLQDEAGMEKTQSHDFTNLLADNFY